MTSISRTAAHVQSPVATGDMQPAILSRWASVRRFTVHYLAMVLAMMVGMVALGPLESLLAGALGRPDLLDGTTVHTLTMAANMTVAMAAWMRFRGHRWRSIAEMSAGMNVPFLVLLVPLWAGLISRSTLMMAGHVLMLLGMAAVMLARRQEYIHHGH
jgi:hypothetical protein